MISTIHMMYITNKTNNNRVLNTNNKVVENDNIIIYMHVYIYIYRERER